MQVQPLIQPAPIQIQPLSQPQAQAQDDSHKMFQELLKSLQDRLSPTDQNDPLAPVGVTPKKTAPSSGDAASSSDSSKGDGSVIDKLSQLLGGDAVGKASSKSGKKDDGPVGLADLLSGKKSFSDTKAGKAVGAIESIGKLLALI